MDTALCCKHTYTAKPRAEVRDEQTFGQLLSNEKIYKITVKDIKKNKNELGY